MNVHLDSASCAQLLALSWLQDITAPLSEVGLNRSERLCTDCGPGFADRC